MPRRGVFTAITESESAKLVALLSSAEDAEAWAGELEDNYFESARQCEIDASWCGMHQCFGPDHESLEANTTDPFQFIVLGGEDLMRKRDDWRVYQVAVLKTAEQMRQAAKACAAISWEQLRARYDSINPNDYDGEKSDEDFEYIWIWFAQVVAFYDRVSKHNAPVLFTATG